jgi:hypothetical protein
MKHLFPPFATSRLATVLGLLAAPASAAWAQTPATFAAAATYSTGNNSTPFGVTAADVNGDGLLDLLTANFTNNTVGVLLGRSVANGGGFAAVQTYPTGFSTNPYAIAVADVNGDGLPDLLTANSGNNSTAGVLLGRSAANGGGFEAAETYSTGAFSNPQGIAVADVNGDGRPDLLTANTSASTAGVLLGQASGGFAAVQTYSTGDNSSPQGIAVADVNGDGRADLVTANTGNSTAGVLLGRASGGFAAVQPYSTGTTSFPYGIAVADVNADGRPDLVTANSNTGTAGVLLGRASGGFAAVQPYSTGSFSNPYAIAVADVNSDGRPDLLVADNASSTVKGLLGRSVANGGGFTAVQGYATGENNRPQGIAIADVNGDGRPDLLTANGSSNTVGVLLNTTIQAPTLSTVAPTSAAVGETLTLTGTNLGGATTVTFAGTSNNTVAAASFISNSATEIKVAVPAGAISGNVTVTTAGGISNGVAFTVNLVQDLVVKDGQEKYAHGNYRNITVQSGGSLYLDGDVTVSGAMQVQTGGTFGTNGYVVSGAGSFELKSGSQIFLYNAGGITPSPVLSGDIQVTGGRTYSSGASYIYAGTTAQATGAGLPGEVLELNIDNSNDVTLTNPVAIRQVLSVYGGGSLRFTNGAVTLLSDANGTASVNYFNNSYPGVFQVQRYVSGDLTAAAAYRHISAPVRDADVQQLTTTGFTPVINPAYNTSATPRSTARPFPTVFGYDETRLRPVSEGGSPATDLATSFDKGWFSPQGLGGDAGMLAVGRGYDVHMPANQTITFRGPLTTSSVTVPLSRTTDDANAGWNLVGNPFAASFDLRDLANTEGVDNAKYVFEATGPYAGQYRTFMPGFGEGAGEGNPLVALGQAFFTRVSEGSEGASLTLSPFATSVGDNTVFHRGTPEARPFVALTLANATGTLRDRTSLYQEASATTGLDSRYDAVKLWNTTGLNLSQQAAGQQMAINGLPAFTSATVVPLTVQVPAAGTYTLQVANLLNLSAGTTVTLVDNATGQRLNLATLPAAGYSFTTTKGETFSNRFVLNLTAAGALATTTALQAGSIGLAPNPAHGRTTVLVPAVAGATQATLRLTDALGRTVRSFAPAALPAAGLRQELNLEGLTPGVYLLQVQAGTEKVTRRLLVD